MEELIKRLERVIATGAPDKDGMHPIGAEAVLEVVKQLSEHGTNLAEVGTDCISRQAAIDICRAPHMRNADCSDFEMAIMMLPPAQPKKGAIEQIKWERDVAIEQLKKLGYGLGEKIRAEKDCISRQAAIDALNNIEIPRNASWYQYYQQALTAVDKLPPAQPERIKGRWEVASTGYSGFMRCSACKVGCCGDYRSMNFCPNCGADMRGEQDGRIN